MASGAAAGLGAYCRGAGLVLLAAGAAAREVHFRIVGEGEASGGEILGCRGAETGLCGDLGWDEVWVLGVVEVYAVDVGDVEGDLGCGV